uniref:Fignl1 interacting regulator of recombination and mitosis n=1 Tax=Hippocampus comes TaxID=109280 RepID=A0A3Q2Z6X7_HIPCM
MSQTNTLLDEVVQWNQETCRQQLKAVLPKLTISSPSEGWDDHIRVLKIITDLFLPHIALLDLENECFSKILPKAVTMFDSIMKELSIQVGSSSSQNTEVCSSLRNILMSLMQIIDAMSACVRHVCTYDEVPDVMSIRTLLSCILKVLRDTFQHCKESEAVYCGHLSVVADLLQSLFKEACALHKALLELLDGLSLDSSSSEEVASDIVVVIHNLLDICSVISNLDMALHANTWKFLIRQSLKYQLLVEEHLHHGDISASLCDNLLASLHNAADLAEQIKHAATQCAEHKLFLKTAKLCRFFANTLVHYVKEFNAFLTRSCGRFHQLYLQIISKFPPSLCAPVLPPSLSEELNAAAVVPMDALLLQLLPLRPFAEVVLQEDPRDLQHELPQCLLLVNVLDLLASQPEEVLQLWHSGSQTHVCRLPLYQAVFCSFQRCYAERKLPVLLPGVMTKGQAQGRVSLHCHVCVHLCASVAVLSPLYLPVLERCLVEATLQADTHTALICGVLLLRCHTVMEFLARFPSSEAENLPIWRHVLLRALSTDARQRVEADVVALAQKALTECDNTCFRNVQVQTHHVLRITLQLLLSITAVLVKNVDVPVIIHVCVDLNLKIDIENRVEIVFLVFSRSYRHVYFSARLQSEIFPKLSSLFGALLAQSSSWLLHQHALEAFAHFAEVTNHEEVISYSLCVEETKSKVVNFLSKVRKVYSQYFGQYVFYLKVFLPPFITQPQAKRARQESAADEEYSRGMRAAETALRTLHALATGKTGTQEPPPPPPSWLASRIQVLHVLLNDLSSATSTNSPT